jgi:hypothetical protein
VERTVRCGGDLGRDFFCAVFFEYAFCAETSGSYTRGKKYLSHALHPSASVTFCPPRPLQVQHCAHVYTVIKDYVTDKRVTHKR